MLSKAAATLGCIAAVMTAAMHPSIAGYHQIQHGVNRDALTVTLPRSCPRQCIGE